MNAHPQILLGQATDWTGQTYHERLQECATALYTHGYILPLDYDRIRNRLTLDYQSAKRTRQETARHG